MELGRLGEEEKMWGGRRRSRRRGGQREVSTRCLMIDKTSCGRGSARDRR